ncbi:MAG: SemiSWEET transporter [Deltaproteobacteria bacterium]|nr:SemiSWEET transporter [Deltaproteobacteria bacterium]
MELTTLLGFAAGTLTTVSFLPQVIKAWKTRHTGDISGYMFIMLVLGIALWMAYGIILRDIPIIAANGVSFVLCAVILYFKARFG